MPWLDRPLHTPPVVRRDRLASGEVSAPQESLYLPICTLGPSRPRARPLPIASHPPKNLTGRRLKGAGDNSPFATASTRGIPLPAAYGEKRSTSRAANPVRAAMAATVSKEPAGP